MRKDIASVDRMVERSLKEGSFRSREECAAAMLNWLILGAHVNPSQLTNSNAARQNKTQSIEDDAYALTSISRPEGALLQYEIIRERDA